MRIGDFSSILTYTPQQVQRTTPATEPVVRQEPTSPERAEGTSSNIGQQIKSAIDNVNQMQSQADELVEHVTTGNTEDSHKAVIAMERALMAVDFTLQVRNKVLEAYQEIMRTQL